MGCSAVSLVMHANEISGGYVKDVALNFAPSVARATL